MTFDKQHELQLLEVLEHEPEITQADLAARVGVAVGTVNWYLKRWTAKGFIKAKRIGRWQWRYLLTPQGLAEKATLASKYFEASMNIYRTTRADAKAMLAQVRDAGYEQVIIDCQHDLGEICELTCLEMGVETAVDSEETRQQLPIIQSQSWRLVLNWPNEEEKP